MKVRVRIQREGARLHENVYDISDADSFGRALAHAWTQIQEQKLKETTSIGALYEVLGESVVDELENAEIVVSRVR